MCLAWHALTGRQNTGRGSRPGARAQGGKAPPTARCGRLGARTPPATHAATTTRQGQAARFLLHMRAAGRRAATRSDLRGQSSGTGLGTLKKTKQAARLEGAVHSARPLAHFHRSRGAIGKQNALGGYGPLPPRPSCSPFSFVEEPSKLVQGGTACGTACARSVHGAAACNGVTEAEGALHLYIARSSSRRRSRARTPSATHGAAVIGVGLCQCVF